MSDPYVDTWYSLTGWARDDNRVDVRGFETPEGTTGVDIMHFPGDEHEITITLNETQADDLRRWLNRRKAKR